MAVSSLIRRKTRTLLTILGVIIGTASIVVMLSLGIAMDESFKEQIASMGDLTIIEIYNYGGGMAIGPGGSQQQMQSPKLDDASVAKLKKIPNVKGVMPIKRAYMKFGAGRYVGHVPIIGIDPTNMEAFDFKVSKGRLLASNDKDVIVYGKNVHYNFYNPKLRNNYYGGMSDQPIVDLMTSKMVMTSDMNYGETRIDVDNQPDKPKPKVYDIKAIGELEESFSEKDYNIYMNITALEKIIEEDRRNNRENVRNSSRNSDKYESISVKVFDFTQVEEVQAKIKEMGFQTYSLTEILNSMREQSKIIQGVLGGIGAISLLVAAIGITNTMIMSIYERTREIGVMKVIGADLDDIKKMFLIEAGMIGFWGGALGIAFSYGLSYLLNTIGGSLMGGGMGMGGASKLSVIPVELALIGLAFATLIGLISGYSPARRAMNISALDAIRNDK